MTTVLLTSLANFDGLAIDGNGYIYVSCWGTNAVYRYDNAFSLAAELVSSGHSGPADIFYNLVDNILAVPNYYSNRVDFISITPVDIEEVPNQMPQAVAMSQNYPNPFNPTTTIKFEIPEPGFVALKVFDVLGNEVTTLVNENSNAGKQSVEFDATGLTSGIYYYQLLSDEFIETKKMIFLK